MEWIAVEAEKPPISTIVVVRDGKSIHCCLHYRVDNQWFSYAGGTPVGIGAFTHWCLIPTANL
jgi:hypothetical protein